MHTLKRVDKVIVSVFLTEILRRRSAEILQHLIVLRLDRVEEVHAARG